MSAVKAVELSCSSKSWTRTAGANLSDDEFLEMPVFLNLIRPPIGDLIRLAASTLPLVTALTAASRTQRITWGKRPPVAPPMYQVRKKFAFFLRPRSRLNKNGPAPKRWVGVEFDSKSVERTTEKYAPFEKPLSQPSASRTDV